MKPQPVNISAIPVFAVGDPGIITNQKINRYPMGNMEEPYYDTI